MKNPPGNWTRSEKDFLTEGDLLELLRTIRAGDSADAERAKKKIAESYKGLVGKVAVSYKNDIAKYAQAAESLDTEDLRQEGYIGLLKAIENFDEEKGAFPSYAQKCIVSAIKDALRKVKGVRLNSEQIDFGSEDYAEEGDDEQAKLKARVELQAAHQPDVEVFQLVMGAASLEEVEKRLLEDKLDQGFIDFVIDLCGLKKNEMDLTVTVDQTRKESQYRALKRWCQKAFGRNWREPYDALRTDMSEIIAEAPEVYRYCLPGEGRNPRRVADILTRNHAPNRPWDANFFRATLVLKAYFTHVFKKPCWRLIAERMQPFTDTELQGKTRGGRTVNKLQSRYKHYLKSLEAFCTPIKDHQYLNERGYFVVFWNTYIKLEELRGKPARPPLK